MKILVTGAKGFIGKNLVSELNNIKTGKRMVEGLDNLEVFEYDLDTNPSLLDKFCANCDFVFNLAGVNRPLDQSDFMTGNFGFASELLDNLKKHNNTCPVMISSSTQAELLNPYGKSKKAGEDLLLNYSKKNGAQVLIYRFPNVFGKWCQPNYNSAVATFCHNIANDIPLQINDTSVMMTLVYIDDIVNELICALLGKENREGHLCYIPTEHKVTLGKIIDLLKTFKENRQTLSVPLMSDEFQKKLYSTYLSYLPSEKFSYPLKMNIDDRGSFTEIIRTPDRGQFSVNISKPGITKGDHWHNTKNEKFVVVSGEALIQFRKIDSDVVIDYNISGDKIEVVDIPTGYTHKIVNKGDSDLITFMWANESFNPEKPDTYFLEV